MENLDIEKFNPTKAEITSLVEQYKDLSITGVDDKNGYEAVHKARMALKTVRVNITKTGKSMREEALAFQKLVISKEKELIEMVEPTERELEAKQKAIDEEKEKIKRVALLPERRQMLAEIRVEIDDEFLLLQNETQFTEYFNARKTEFLEEKERLMRLEQEKIEAEKRAIEEAKMVQEREAQRQVELEHARKEAAEKAVIDEQRKAQEKIEQQKKDEENRIANEEAEQKKLESQKKYQDFLSKHDFQENDNFHIERVGNRVMLYKKVGEIII